ncbi:MAG: hydrogenase maturation protease [Bacteroidota bacterium]
MEAQMQAITDQVAILGFGNPVRADDGIGIYVIKQLQEKLSNIPNVSLFDMGTSAFEVLYKLKGHQKIILVDAVLNSGQPVGSVFKLPASEVEAQVIDDPMVFLHGLKWDQALSYARKILRDEYPEDIEVYLVAIENTKFNTGIGQEAQHGGDQVVQLLIEQFNNH